MCIIEVCHWYTWFTLITYKIYINTPLLSHNDTPSYIMILGSTKSVRKGFLSGQGDESEFLQRRLH